MAYDPNEPTRPLGATPPVGPPPGAPIPPPIYEREREYIADDDGPWRAHVLQRIDSLKSWLAVLSVLSVLALGAAILALLSASEDDDGARTTTTRSAGSSAQVEALEERVEDIDGRIDERATKNSVTEVSEAQEALSKRLDELEGDAGQDAAQPDAADTQALQQSIDDVTTQLEELGKRVDELEQNQAP